MEELYHYGVKGQKRGVRRYQYEDGSLTPEGRVHYNVGPPRNSYTLKKGTTFYRTSSVEEKDVRKGAYVTPDPITAVYYQNDGIDDALDFRINEKNPEIYAVKIQNLDKVKVLKGKQVIDDLLSGKEKSRTAKIHNKLSNSGHYDGRSFLEKLNIKEELNKSGKLTDMDQTKAAYLIDHYLKTNKDDIYDKYKKLGYDAIEDPMDSMLEYYRPMIILNNEKFEVVEAGRKTAEQVLKEKKDVDDYLDEIEAKQKGNK